MDTTAPRTSTSQLSGPAAIHDFLVTTYGTGLRMQGAIAARWGFVNHSRFTATYRQTYGVLPRVTLAGG